MTGRLRNFTGAQIVQDHEQRIRDLERRIKAGQSNLPRRVESGSGLLSLLTMRNTAAQTYLGGYSIDVATFNTTDAESFGTGLSYETSTGFVLIETDGWYQAVANLAVLIVAGQKGHIRLTVQKGVSVKTPVASNSTYAEDEDTWLGAASKPFEVSGGYSEVVMQVSHDMRDAGTGMTLPDMETGDTFLSVFRIA